MKPPTPREEVLEAALRAAGREILGHDTAHVETSIKSTAGDLVTAADLASEKIIIDTIKAAFPDDLVISEEADEGHEKLSDARLPGLSAWIVDPIDGTNNFKRGLAYSGISIGYIVAGKPVLGGILDPYRDTLYLGRAGRGATCNGQPIRISDRAVLDAGTRVCTSNSSVAGDTQANLDRFAKLGDVWVDVLGSAVLSMADVASGKLELYFHNCLKPWDNAAAFLIAEEAGAKFVGLQGQSVNWLTAEVVLGNPALVDLFIAKTNMVG